MSSFIFGMTYNNSEATVTMMQSCFWCNTGTCTEQIGGTGWTGCEDASPGGEFCGFLGSPCSISSEPEEN